MLKTLIPAEVVSTGQINGWEDRLAAYDRAKSVIGTGTNPPKKGASQWQST